MQYYERLRNAREDRDITRRTVCNHLGIMQQQLYKYETGKQEMTVSRLQALCEFYGVSSDYILGLPKNLSWER